ncbi:MAG: hypothetical protein ACE5ED_03380 [Rhodothalassiaceae bacterium]
MALSEFERKRRSRNIALALLLFGFVALLFVVSIVKFEGLAG